MRASDGAYTGHYKPFFMQNMKNGLASCHIRGHLGELIQGRLGTHGPVALITLPAPDLKLRVSHRAGPFTLFQPQGRAISRPHLRDILRGLDCPVTGRFIIDCPFPVGGGGGASTATRLAIGRILRPDLPDAALEQIVLSVEGASDPLLRAHPERLLWASRQGRVLAALPPLPRMRIVGGFDGPSLLTDPRDDHFPDIADLVAAWPAACADPAALGALVTQSARRTAAMRGIKIAPLLALSERLGALGCAIAHTGAARALLLPATRDPQPALDALGRLGFTHLVTYDIGG